MQNRPKSLLEGAITAPEGSGETTPATTVEAAPAGEAPPEATAAQTAEATNTPDPEITAAQDEPASDLPADAQNMYGITPYASNMVSLKLRLVEKNTQQVLRSAKISGTDYTFQNGEVTVELTVNRTYYLDLPEIKGYTAPQNNPSFKATSTGFVCLTSDLDKEKGTDGVWRIYVSYNRKTACDISLQSSAYGSAVCNVYSPDGKWTENAKTAVVGDEVYLKLTPDEGYELDRIVLTAGAETLQTTAQEGVYTFTMPAQDITLNVTFKALTKIHVSGMNINGFFYGKPGAKFLSLAEENGWNGASNNRWILWRDKEYHKVTADTVIQQDDVFTLAHYIDEVRVLHIRQNCDGTDLPGADQYDRYSIEADVIVTVTHKFDVLGDVKFNLLKERHTLDLVFAEYIYNNVVLTKYKWYADGEPLTDWSAQVPLAQTQYSLQSYTVTIPAALTLDAAQNSAAGSMTVALDTTKYNVPGENIQVRLQAAAFKLRNSGHEIAYTIQKNGTALSQGDTVLSWNYGTEKNLSATLKIATAAFNDAPAGTYSDRLTFSVSVETLTENADGIEQAG